MRVELGLQAERSVCDATFNGAIEAWPDYPSVYFNRANFLLPRWYGAEGELAKDLEHSADKIGGESGDVVYVQTIWYMQGLVASSYLLQEYNLSWDRANRGLAALEKRYPASVMVENEAAHLAVLAHDVDAAKKYFGQTQGEIDPYCWPSTNQYIRFARLVYAYDK
jgi:hypothetical protein